MASAMPGGFWMSSLRSRETAIATWPVSFFGAPPPLRRWRISASRAAVGYSSHW